MDFRSDFHGFKVEVDKPEDMGKIDALIHDRDFDVSKISCDDNILKFPFTQFFEGKKMIKKVLCFELYENFEIECVLEIHGVNSYEINDTERIQIYPFNKLEYDSEIKVVTVVACIPIGITVDVSFFKIVVKIKDKILKIRRIWLLPSARTIWDVLDVE